MAELVNEVGRAGPHWHRVREKGRWRLIRRVGEPDLAREAAGAGANLGDGEAALALVLADDVEQVGDVARVEALHERVRRVQNAVLCVLHDRLDRVLRACHAIKLLVSCWRLVVCQDCFTHMPTLLRSWYRAQQRALDACRTGNDQRLAALI